MENEIKQQPVAITPADAHSHKKLYATIAASLGAAVILMGIVVIMIMKNSSMQSGETLQNQANLELAPTPEPVNSQMQSVTPVPVTNKSNLDDVSKTLDSTDTT